MRLEITRRADLAVRALRLLEVEGRMKAGGLAGALGSTPGYVPQVLGPLVKRGWVGSEPGPSGGYSLLVGLGEVSVLDVVEAIDGPTDAGKCVVADRRCGSGPFCAMHIAWSRARAELTASLASTTIAELDVPVAP
jgi:Rrf2 family protein